MNICIAIEKFDPGVGGAERYCWDLAHFLAERGHEIKIICIRAKAPLHPSIHIIEVMCIRFPQALRHVSFAFMHYLKARSLPDYIHFCVGNTVYMDIYQPHGGLHRAWFIRDTMRFNPAIRWMVRLVKRASFKDMIQRLFEWWTLKIRRPDVIAISEMVAQDIRGWFDYTGSEICLIPNGIDTGRFAADNMRYRREIRTRYSLSEDEAVFLFVATNMKLKGFSVLVDACRELGDLSFQVLVIGPDDAWAKRAARDVSEKIIFGGKAQDLEKIYPACNCLVHPTYYDACSLVVLESLASGVPVITTSANGAKMFVKRDNGYVIPAGDVAALAGAMKDILCNDKQNCISMAFRKHDEVFAQLERFMEDHGK